MVAVGKTTVLMADITSLASEASLVSLVKKWNVMVPRMEMTMILRKRAANVTSFTAVLALTALLVQLAPRASVASEDCVASMASMASMAPMASMVWASMALVASMVWVTALKRRELSNGMPRYSPLKTWLCSSTKQAWEADGSRSSRRVDGVTEKKELMGTQIWAMVVTLAWMDSMASMVASMVSMAPMASMVLASAASMAGVTALRWRKLRNMMLVYGPEDLLVRRWSCNSGEITVVCELGQNTPKIWLCSTTILAEENLRSRCSRRVDDAKVKEELMGCHLWALVATRLSANGGSEWWRRWVASMDGVDGCGRWWTGVFDTGH